MHKSPSCGVYTIQLILPGIHPAINDGVVHRIRHSHQEYDNVYLLYIGKHGHTGVVVDQQKIHVHW